MPFNLQTFTLFHVVLSLAGIISGLVVARGITGFGFPAKAGSPFAIAKLLVLAASAVR